MVWRKAKQRFPYANTYDSFIHSARFFALLSMGMNYFHHRAGISGLGMATTFGSVRLSTSYWTLYLSFAAYEYRRRCPRYCPRAVVFLCFCPADAETEKNAHSPDSGTDPAFYRSAHPLKMGFSPFLILATDSVIIIALNAVLQHFGGPEYGDTLITCATIVQSYMLPSPRRCSASPEAPSPSSASTWVPEG